MNRQLRSIGGGHVMPTPGNSNNTPQVGFARNNLIFVNAPPSTPRQAGQFAPLKAQRGLNSGYKLRQPGGECRGLYTQYNLRQTTQVTRKSGGGRRQSQDNLHQTTQVTRRSGGGRRQSQDNLRQTTQVARKSGGGRRQSQDNLRQTTQVARKSGGGKRQGERAKVTTATGCGQTSHKHGNRIGLKGKKKPNVSKIVMVSRKGGHTTPPETYKTMMMMMMMMMMPINLIFLNVRKHVHNFLVSSFPFGK